MIRGTSSTFPSWLANDFFTMNPLPFHPRPFIPSTIRNSPSYEPCSIHDRPSRRFGFLFFLYFLFFSRYDLPLRSEATRTLRGEFVFCTVEFLFIKGIDPLFHWDMMLSCIWSWYFGITSCFDLRNRKSISNLKLWKFYFF